MAIGPQIRGIYQIKSVSTGRIYIGYSTNIKIRWSNHRYHLKTNKHKNPYLQNHYNKYGKSDLVYIIIEELPYLTDNEIALKEGVYIKRFNANIKPNFNMTLGNEYRCSELLKIPCAIKNIQTGEVINFTSMTEASNYIGVDRSSMSKILNGKKKQMKGWCSANIPYPESEFNRKTRVLTHKDFGDVIVGENMCEFARKYDLNTRIIHRLFTKPDRNKSHKGWKPREEEDGQSNQ